MSKGTSIRKTAHWILLALLVPTLSQAALDDVTKIDNDPTIVDWSQNYEVVVVREAIAKCRAGKYQEALPVLVDYAEADDIGANYVLAQLYLEGLGVGKSKPTAERLLQSSVAVGHAPSMIQLGRLKEDSSPAEAVQLFKMASAAGNIEAHLKLGQISEKGALGTTANPKLAFMYYQKAFKAESPLGIYQIARCYDDGIGVSPNAIESTRLFRRAALAGVAAANTVMARRYFDGKGVEPDPVAAVGWLMRGAQAGSSESMVLLGQRFENGDAMGQDLNQAGQLYSAAANQGDPTGRYSLALLYLHGKGTPADPVRAFVLLEGAQSLPKAKSLYEKLSKELDSSQLALARTQNPRSKNQELQKVTPPAVK